VIFGSINYINLLPFRVFLKRYLRSNQSKQAFTYRRDVPSGINRAFAKGTVNAAFISSIRSRGCKCTDLGIIAEGNVHSVFVLEGDERIDTDSATSNVLANVLGLKGRVLIGDKALKNYLDNGTGTDLAQKWYEKTGLPFAFARLCYNRHGDMIEKLARRFAAAPVRIPRYILLRESRLKGIPPGDILWYLEHINYKFDHRSHRALKLFLKKSRSL